ncbi:MAG: ABC transporter permease [Chloroflexota bacterium]
MSSRMAMWPTRKVTYLFDLLRELVARDLKIRYKRSALGLAWSLLNPLAQLLVFGFLFGMVLPLNIPNFPLFLFSGVLVWNWFSTSLLSAATAITDNRELIKRPGFHAAILPVVTVTSNLIHFVLALPILLAFALISGVGLSPVLVLLPLVMALQFILTLGLSYFVATFQVTFRDTQYLLGVILMLGFYLTPVFYAVASVPAHLQWLYRLNPVAQLLVAYRSILIYGKMPDWLSLLALYVMACLVLIGGYAIFSSRAGSRFVEEL